MNLLYYDQTWYLISEKKILKAFLKFLIRTVQIHEFIDKKRITTTFWYTSFKFLYFFMLKSTLSLAEILLLAVLSLFSFFNFEFGMLVVKGGQQPQTQLLFEMLTKLIIKEVYSIIQQIMQSRQIIQKYPAGTPTANCYKLLGGWKLL